MTNPLESTDQGTSQRVGDQPLTSPTRANEGMANEALANQLLADWHADFARAPYPSGLDTIRVALEQIRRRLDLPYAAWIRGESGQWRTLAATGSELPIPLELCADALDRELPLANDLWVVAPLDHHAADGELLLVGGVTRGTLPSPPLVAAVAQVFRTWQKTVSASQLQRRRIERLEAILAIAAQWNQTFDLQPLLERMAEASTRLLQAERASVFLWDRAAKTLIGRPALGVPGGELRVPDDRGVVGQVLNSRQPVKVDDNDAANTINRSVDQQLKFHTRNLIAVPLIGRQGDRLGVFEVLNKRQGNFTDEDQAALVELASHAAIALENSRQFNHLLQTRNQLADQAASSVQLIGECVAIQRLRETLHKIARTELAVLITGENGTGKEVVAQLIHYLSERRRESLVAVNCAALTESLLESELFGHEKGAFTDARESRAGKFELAARGTLFLDEIGEMSLSGQAKLLRVLEEKMVVRVGGTTPLRTDARVIAATNQRLPELVRVKRFREDLFFRLNVATLELPPLRQRGGDILLLADHFLAEFGRRARRSLPEWTEEARQRLLEHSWPGNVRELRNLIERLFYLHAEDRIEGAHIVAQLTPLPAAVESSSLALSLAEATDQFQSEFIKRQIAAADGNMTVAAERLGLHRSNFYRKLRQLGLDEHSS
ncbi:MAG: sigma 54-interacting transcriptional regulator [Planctomycetota bacterium]